ncbi:unnamed protein product [Peniophora sp. CBMAI 1063]|nr:unnamed protein product [Peniophora sp. CBMAI 1063]
MSSEDVPPQVNEPVRSPSPPPSLHSRPSHGRKMSVDADAQAQVISSLRTQVDDLFSQVTQLNGKLVKSYNRVSDLEDELHVSSAAAREASVKIAALELERATHLSALNTGLLVEREHVAAELSKLMERATDEAARRGQAESARMEIEKDLDDLSAGLFDQANTMVAEARFARAQSERKAEEAARSLREAEDLVRLMQGQMQQLQQRATIAERAARDVVPQAEIVAVGIPRLLGSHAGYTEFIAFVAHIRTLRSAAGQPPIISTLLHTPFLARLVAEDTEPTVRLDLAPGLNWLTRRTFISAIHAGQLDIAPAPTSSLLSPDSATHGLSCALCGAIIIAGTASPTDTTPASRSNLGSLATAARNNSWSQLLSKPLTSSRPSSPPPHSHSRQQSLDISVPAQIFVCRLATPVPASVPVPGQPRSAQTNQYPLCASGWCLARLRATCTLWSFIRTGVVERVWEDTPAPPPPPQRLASQSLNSSPVSPATPTNGGVTKKRSLWGVASVLGFGDDKEKEKAKEDKGKAKELPPPPPHHPAEKPVRRSVPPPLASPVPRPAAPGHSPIPPPRSPNPRSASTQQPAPPPLPRRATSRAAVTPVGLKPSSSQEPDSDGGFHTPAEELPPTTNGDGEHVEGEHKPGHAKKDSMLFEAPFTPPATPPVPEGAPVEGEAKPAEASAPVADMKRAPAATDAQPSEAAVEPTSGSIPAAEPAPASEAAVPAEPRTPTNPAFAEGAERTGSPAPPPVPRRAPARRAVPPAPGTPGRVGTPVGGERVGTPDNGERASTPAPDAAASAIEAPAPDAAADAAPVPSEAPVPEAPATEAPSAEGSATEAPASSDAPAPESTEPKPPLPARPRRAPRDSVHLRGGSVSSISGLEKVVNGVDDVKEDTDEHAPVVSGVDKGKGKAIEPSSSAESDIKLADERVDTDAEPITFANNSEQPSPAVEEPEELAPDGTPFVRGASWEARAWKELIRLREDMFWARVGGVR